MIFIAQCTALVKDEKNYDKFDRAFSAYFKGLEDLYGLLESLSGRVVGEFENL